MLARMRRWLQERSTGTGSLSVPPLHLSKSKTSSVEKCFAKAMAALPNVADRFPSLASSREKDRDPIVGHLTGFIHSRSQVDFIEVGHVDHAHCKAVGDSTDA